MGSVVVAYRLSFSEACRIFPDQGSCFKIKLQYGFKINLV